jgi:DNA-binding transcriptional MerR regulator
MSATDDFTHLPVFELNVEATYSLDVIAELSGVTPQTILQYTERGLISPVADTGPRGFQFDEKTLRTLRRIENLLTTCEMNMDGLKLMLDLMDEVEQLREDLRARR